MGNARPEEQYNAYDFSVKVFHMYIFFFVKFNCARMQLRLCRFISTLCPPKIPN